MQPPLTIERVILDPSGYSLAFSSWDEDQMMISGFGPRGGQLGQLEIERQGVDRIIDGFRALEEILEEQAGKSGSLPLIIESAPVLAVPAMYGQGLWIYMRGPGGGYRRPLELHSSKTCAGVADHLA
jgi:hypothetical protein